MGVDGEMSFLAKRALSISSVLLWKGVFKLVRVERGVRLGVRLGVIFGVWAVIALCRDERGVHGGGRRRRGVAVAADGVWNTGTRGRVCFGTRDRAGVRCERFVVRAGVANIVRLKTNEDEFTAVSDEILAV